MDIEAKWWCFTQPYQAPLFFEPCLTLKARMISIQPALCCYICTGGFQYKDKVFQIGGEHYSMWRDLCTVWHIQSQNLWVTPEWGTCGEHFPVTQLLPVSQMTQAVWKHSFLWESFSHRRDLSQGKGEIFLPQEPFFPVGETRWTPVISIRKATILSVET